MWELFGKLRSTTGGKRETTGKGMVPPGRRPSIWAEMPQKPAGEPFPSTRRETPGGHHFPHPPPGISGPGSIDVSFYRL